MRRPLVPIALLVLGAGLTVLNHVRVVARDDGWLVEVDGRPVDAVGALRERWRADGSACAAVQPVQPESDAWAQVLAVARTHSPPDSHSARLLSLQRAEAFYIAELAFDRLAPAVVLLRAAAAGTDEPATPSAHGERLQILEQAVWSGSTEPWVPGPFIRRYLRSRAPAVPGALIDCFGPQSPGFARNAPGPPAGR